MSRLKIFHFTSKELDSFGRYTHSLSLLSVATFVGLLVKDGEFTELVKTFMTAAVVLLVQGTFLFRATRRKEDLEKKEANHG